MDALEVTEQHDQNGQTYRGFSSSNSQDEENENLAGEILEEMGKRDEIHVDRKQHQLDGHQQDDQVFPVKEDADDADCEKNRTQYQEM